MRSVIARLALINLLASGCADANRAPTLPAPRSPTAARVVASSTPVTTVVHDSDAAGNALLTRSDDYNGAGLATYTSINKITSQIESSGGWKLYLGSQTVRTMYLVLASQGIPVPDGYYAVNVEVYSQCFDQSLTPVGLLTMAAGTSNDNCSFGIDFSYARTKYKLVMSPKFSGTGLATVTCNAATNGSCADWTIVPNTMTQNAAVANLYHYSNTGSLVFDGAYHNSYFVTASR